MSDYLIPFKDYERIYQCIYSILHSEDAELLNSSLHFAFLGATILNHHYKIEATVQAGISAVCLGETEDDVLLYGQVVDGQIVANQAHCHCWLEVDGWLIDFSAPLFAEQIKKEGNRNTFPPLMLQKELSQAASQPSLLLAPGDFMLHASPELLEALFTEFFSQPLNNQLLDIATVYYKKASEQMPDVELLKNDNGDKRHIVFQSPYLIGAF